MTPEEFAALLGARPSGAGKWKARCPGHADRRPSLSVGTGDDGRVLIRCMAGCPAESVLTAMGLAMRDLMPEASVVGRPPKPVPPRNRAAAEKDESFATLEGALNALRRRMRRGIESRAFHYLSADGRLVGVVVRWDATGDKDKAIRPVALGDDGRWRIQAMPAPRPPYRLPELADADRVFVVEGEKVAEALREIGLVATCAAGGAKAAGMTDWSVLAGKEVAILPDNDEPGEAYAEEVGAIVARLTPPATVRVARLPELGAKDDAVDLIEIRRAEGVADEAIASEILRTVDAAEPVAITAPPIAPKSRSLGIVTRPNLIRLADVEPREVAWLWSGRIPLGRLTLLVGVPGLGKSFVTTDWASRVTTGTPWPDGSDCVRGSVLFVCAEDDPADTIRPRLDAHRADVSQVHLLTSVVRSCGDEQTESMFSLVDPEALEQAIEKVGNVRLVVVDPIGSYLGRSDAHRDNEVRSVLSPISLLAERHGAAVVMVAHRRKSGGGGSADESVLGSRAFTGLARSVLHLSPDPKVPSRRLLLAGKNNLAPPADGLGFTIAGEPPAVRWDRDPVDITADDALRAESEPNARKSKRPREAAADWLRGRLEAGPAMYADLVSEAQGEGLSKRTLERAADELGIEKSKADFRGGWRWSLPEEPGLR